MSVRKNRIGIPMKILPFKLSQKTSIGVELEIQLINPHTYALISRAKDLIRIIKESSFNKRIKPEITQSMIEINSSIHTSPLEMLNELYEIQTFLLAKGENLNIAFC